MIRAGVYILALLPFIGWGQARIVRALFIGNSYTYYNNMPQMVAAMAHASGDSLVQNSWTPGGYTFHDHFTDANCLQLINAGHYDFVILQAQSQEPSFSKTQVYSSTMIDAVRLDSAIHHAVPCATVIYYETWGRKNGDQSNCASYPPVCTYTGMQNRLRDSYKWFADTTHAIICPAGEGFRHSIAAQPTLELYQSDESHPQPEGSFIAASMFYEIMFGKSVLSNSFTAALSNANVSWLHNLAHSTLNDSLNTWNIGKYYPISRFATTPFSAVSYSFTGNAPTMNNAWDFGDGTTSSSGSVYHTFAAAGNYKVRHIVYNACHSDTSIEWVQVPDMTGMNKQYEYSHVVCYPNPVETYLNFHTAEPVFLNGSVVRITDVSGKVVREMAFSTNMNVSSLPPGIYFIEIEGWLMNARGKFIKKNEAK